MVAQVRFAQVVSFWDFSPLTLALEAAGRPPSPYQRARRHQPRFSVSATQDAAARQDEKGRATQCD